MKDEVNKTLKDFRDAAKLTQTELAQLMGMGLSSYQDLETGFSKFKQKHMMVLERVSLRLAVERGDLNLALPAIRRDALDYGRHTNESASGAELAAAFARAVRALVPETAGVTIDIASRDGGKTYFLAVDDNGRTLRLHDWAPGAWPPSETVAETINAWLAEPIT